MSASTIGPKGTLQIAVLLLLAVLVLSGFASLPFTAGARSAPLPVAGARAPNPTVARAAAGPSVNLSGSFDTNFSGIGTVPYADWYCTMGSCFDQAQNPTLVNLPDTAVGVGYSLITTYNSTNFGTCTAAPYTESRVAFSVSPDNGTSFGGPVFLPTPATPCDYVQQLEPSFAVSGSTVFGVYVSTNATSTELNGPWIGANPPAGAYTIRSFDDLAISNSTDNGTSFGAATIISTANNISDPVLVSSGKSLYVLYENISNGTTGLPSTYPSANLPISENLLYSPNDGATWHGPYVLPGENSSQFNNSMGGSISVNSAGTLAVAYATNRSCINYCAFSPYSANGDDVVLVTSATNGTSWSAIRTIAKGQGEITRTYSYSQFSPTGSGLFATFQDSPMTSVTWGTGADLYVAWEAAPNLNTTQTPAYYYNYSRVVVYAGGSTNGGVSWTTAQISAGLRPLTAIQGIYTEDWFDPTVAFHAGTVELTFSYVNWDIECGYESFGTGFTTDSYSQWVSTSTNGYTYTAPAMIYISTRSEGFGYYTNMGFHASIGFNATGSPLFAYALADGFYYPLQPGTSDQIVTLSVSSAFVGATTTVTFNESGLAPSSPWQVAINGATVSTSAASVNVSGIPLGEPVTISWPGTPTPFGYRTELAPVLNLGPHTTFTGPTTVWLNFTTFFGVSFLPAPNDYYLSVEIANYGAVFPYQFEFTWDTYLSGGSVFYETNGCPTFPWYLPSGMHLAMGPVGSYPIEATYYTQQFVSYWNGTGLGSYTGAGAYANLTVSSPFNESLWDLGIGTYSERFTPIGLPATSTYSFDVDGSPYSAAGTTPVTVPDLVTGPHWVTNVTATSTKTGWSYFGQSQGGNPLEIPLQPDDNLTFAFVNTSAASGTVSFHAIGITPGSEWRLEFNGTDYSSVTPWINVTARPGTYPVSAGDVVSANGTAALAPSGFGPNASVVPSNTYPVNFTGTFRLSVLAAVGGTVAPAGSAFWVAPNSTESFNATPSAGYTFGGWTGLGLGSYTGANTTAVVHPGGPVSESASFVPEPPNHFGLIVNETGLPAGTRWTISLDGTGYSSNASSFVINDLYSCAVSGALGTYALAVPAVGGSAGTEFVAGASTPSTACVTHPLSIAYTTSYAVTVSATVGGSIVGATPGVVSWVSSGNSLDLSEEADTNYTFLGWTGTGPGSWTVPTSSIIVSPTGPVTELAAFALKPAPVTETYTVNFTASSALPAGTPWVVDFNGTPYASSTDSVVIAKVPNGTYSYSVPLVGGAAAGTQYVATPAGTSVHVAGKAVPVAVPFDAQFWVSISSTGAGSTGPASGWFASGKSVLLNATPSGSALFEGWSGTGSGSYTGSSQGPSIQVLGPITERATFVAPPSSTTTTGSSNASPSTLLVAGLAVAGLVIGVVVGLVFARRGRPPASDAPSSDASPEEASP
jgi:hypothetical protein